MREPGKQTPPERRSGHSARSRRTGATGEEDRRAERKRPVQSRVIRYEGDSDSPGESAKRKKTRGPSSRAASSARGPNENPPQKKARKPKRKKRRGNYILIYLMVAILILGAIATLSLTVLFGIETVKVEGDSRYSVEQILAAADVPVGENLLRYKKEEASAAIKSQLPYIDEVKIKKVLPGTVEITVEDAVPAFAFVEEDRYLLVSESGRALEYVETKPDGFILIFGAAFSEPVLGQAMPYEQEDHLALITALLDEIEKQEFTGVKEIDLRSSTEITMLYEDRVKLLVGTSNDLDYKISFAKKLLAGEIESDAKGELDLSRLSDENSDAYFRAASSSENSGEEASNSEGDGKAEGE